MFTPEGASLEVKVVLQCQNEEAQKHLKIFFEIMDTSSHHAAYTSGMKHRAAGGRGSGGGGGGGDMLDVTGYCTSTVLNAHHLAQGSSIATGAVWQSMLACTKLISRPPTVRDV